MRNSLIRSNRPNNDIVSDPFRAMESLFENFWRDVPRGAYNSDTAQPLLRPAMDLIEDEHAYTVRVDLPGLSAEDVQVAIDDNVLTISGQVGDTVEKEGERFHYRERVSGSFQRSVRLPNTINGEAVEASFDNGVLNISLPKRPEAQPRRIEIKANNG